MVFFPNAKINIGLWVTSQRPDGFHDIETLFYPCSLTERLEIELSEQGEGVEFECSGEPIQNEISGSNLCCKAYRLLAGDCHLPPVKISLHKQIPVGAGLGGGSSDAAYTLKGLNRLCRLGLSDAALVQYAVRLGSDCAFFIRSLPAIGTGKGDALHPVNVSPAGYSLLIVKPSVSISTAEAYSWVTPSPRPYRLKDLLQLPLPEWRHHITNDFEKPVFYRYPTIERIKKTLYERGAEYAALSGSGSVVYGIFRCLPDRPERLFPECFVWSAGMG
ncbi:MAG: 4-(cytidine 5'-diphospho)-2-C-methyl-D-erythritol kinase [Bacteroidales bacterium]|nr:4-(cytidine 5'-diphospho)-2-C-methyl-D-erythritol kinase [Bacteroidales bacterium]